MKIQALTKQKGQNLTAKSGINFTETDNTAHDHCVHAGQPESKFYTDTDNTAHDHCVHAGQPESESSPKASPKLSSTLLQSSSELAVSALFSQLLHLQASVHGMFALKHEHRRDHSQCVSCRTPLAVSATQLL